MLEIIDKQLHVTTECFAIVIEWIIVSNIKYHSLRVIVKNELFPVYDDLCQIRTSYTPVSSK